jgi:uncharacterized membrane protein YhhN
VHTELQRIFGLGSIERANRDMLLLWRPAGRSPRLLLVLSVLLLVMVLRTADIIIIVVVIPVVSVSAMAIVMVASAAHGPVT